jgi:hypothetical protein
MRLFGAMLLTFSANICACVLNVRRITNQRSTPLVSLIDIICCISLDHICCRHHLLYLWFASPDFLFWSYDKIIFSMTFSYLFRGRNMSAFNKLISSSHLYLHMHTHACMHAYQYLPHTCSHSCIFWKFRAAVPSTVPRLI